MYVDVAFLPIFFLRFLGALHLKVKLLAISSSLTMGVFGTIKEVVQVSAIE